MGEKKIGEGKGGKYLVSGEEEKRRKRRNIWLVEEKKNRVGKCLDKGRGQLKKSIFLGKSPKLWVGGGQES